MLVLSKGAILVSRVRSSLCPLGLASPSRTCLTTHHRLAGFRLASPPAFHPLSGPPRPSPFSPPLWLPPSRIFIHFSAPSPTTSPLPLLFPPFPISSLLSLLILTPDPAGHCCLPTASSNFFMSGGYLASRLLRSLFLATWRVASAGGCAVFTQLLLPLGSVVCWSPPLLRLACWSLSF